MIELAIWLVSALVVFMFGMLGIGILLLMSGMLFVPFLWLGETFEWTKPIMAFTLLGAMVGGTWYFGGWLF